SEALQAFRLFLGTNDMLSYLTMMAPRLIELHRVLRRTGSLCLHCDPTASHYLKLLLDAVFGPEHFQAEIIWKRTSAHSDAKQGRKNVGHIHDVILFYAKGEEWTWNPIHTPYDDAYIKSHYSLTDPTTGRRFRTGDLTASRPGGDTKYEWRVKRAIGTASWEGDLDDEYRNPRPRMEYRGVKPYKGRYWAYSRENLAEFE